MSNPYEAVTKEFTTEDDLIEIVTSFTWSPFVFTKYRHEDDFISTDLIAFDIDSGMTIEEAEKVANTLELTCLCLPSTSHTPEAHRFRVIFPTSRTIFNKDEYRETYAKYAEFFNVDPACKDLARFYFGSTTEAGFYLDGTLLVPEKASEKHRNSSRNDFDPRDRVIVTQDLETLVERLYGEPREKIPEGIAYFLENAPDNLEGETYIRCNSFLFSCGLAGLPEDRIKDVFYSLYKHEITSVVEKTVDKIIKQGYDEREEEL